MPMPYRLEEGMDVRGPDGKKLGTVARVVVGGETREPRFFVIEKGLVFKKDFLVPREAILRVDDEGAHVGLTKDQLERFPEYEGRPPAREEAERAYETLGARRHEGGFRMESFPPTGDEETIERLGRRGAMEGDEGAEEPYLIVVEEYLVLPREEREQQGFRSEWG